MKKGAAAREGTAPVPVRCSLGLLNPAQPGLGDLERVLAGEWLAAAEHDAGSAVVGPLAVTVMAFPPG